MERSRKRMPDQWGKSYVAGSVPIATVWEGWKDMKRRSQIAQDA
jgi:hypothetical protein